MFNEAEKSNVTAAVLKFAAVGLIIVGMASVLVPFSHSLQLALHHISTQVEGLWNSLL